MYNPEPNHPAYKPTNITLKRIWNKHSYSDIHYFLEPVFRQRLNLFKKTLSINLLQQKNITTHFVNSYSR